MGRPRNPLGDPVGETADGRVWFYPSGFVTQDRDRKFTRKFKADVAARELFIAEKRAELLALRGTGLPTPADQIPGPHRLIEDACDAFIDHLKAIKAPQGTVEKYASVIRTWVKPTIGGNLGTDLGTLTLYKAVCEAAFAKGRALNTVVGITTTLGALGTWAVEDWWPENPYGDERRLRKYLKELRRRTRSNAVDEAAAASAEDTAPVDEDGDEDQGINLAACPTWANITALARAIEHRESLGNPYGDRAPRRQDLVSPGVAAQISSGVETFGATGTRLCEGLVMHTSRINLETGRVKIDRQLDRYKPWIPGEAPPLRAPKHGKVRYTQCLSYYLPKLRLLCEWADEHNNGWLFPPPRGQKWWADAFAKMVERGIELLNNDVAAGKLEAKLAWGWRPHYTRHYYGSICLTPTASGGYGLDLDHISKCMGHADPSTTARIYIHAGPDAEQHMRTATRRTPG